MNKINVFLDYNGFSTLELKYSDLYWDLRIVKLLGVKMLWKRPGKMFKYSTMFSIIVLIECWVKNITHDFKFPHNAIKNKVSVSNECNGKSVQWSIERKKKPCDSRKFIFQCCNNI